MVRAFTLRWRLALSTFLWIWPSLAWPASSQEAGPTLEVQTASGQSEFHIGERIPLKLTFRSPSDSGYEIVPYGGDRDRDGEWGMDRFEVTPLTGWADPLATFLRWRGPVPEHFRPAQEFSKSNPVILNLDLNQWVRFDAPGTYTLKVLSYRVSKKVPLSENPILSNAVQLHIVPATPEWQQAQLDDVRDKVDPKNVRDPDYINSVAALRYLTSPAAIEVMTSMLRYINYQVSAETRLGLIGLPDSLHQTAIDSMTKRIEEPDFPISPFFFETAAFLHVTASSDRESIVQQLHGYESSLWLQIDSMVAKKEPAARAQTIQTLLF